MNSKTHSSLDFKRFFPILIGTALVVPLAAGIVPYYAKYGDSPISTAFYLLCSGFFAAGVAVFKHPRLSVSVVLLLTLQVMRMGDAILFHPTAITLRGEKIDVASTTSGAFIFALSVLCLTGDRAVLRKICLFAAGLTILLCVSSDLWQWLNPSCLDTESIGRSSGWLYDANSSADAIVIMLGIFLALSPFLWLSAAAVAISFSGLFCTLSRSGSAVFFLTFIAYVIFSARKRLGRVLIVGVLFVIIVAAVSRYFGSGDHSVQGDWVAKQNTDRENFIIGKGIAETDLDDTERVDIFKEAIAGVIANPLWGYGTGAAQGEPFAPHNEFMAVWLENGMLGIILYTLATCLLLRECVRRQPSLLIACVPIVALIPFSQTLLEDRSYLFCWIVTAAMLQSEKPSAALLEARHSLLRAEQSKRLWRKIQDLCQPGDGGAVRDAVREKENKF